MDLTARKRVKVILLSLGLFDDSLLFLALHHGVVRDGVSRSSSGTEVGFFHFRVKHILVSVLCLRLISDLICV